MGAAVPTGRFFEASGDDRGGGPSIGDVVRDRDRLHLAVLPQLEVGRRQIGDEIAVLVGDDRVDANGVDADAKARRVGLRRRLRAGDEARTRRAARYARMSRRT